MRIEQAWHKWPGWLAKQDPDTQVRLMAFARVQADPNKKPKVKGGAKGRAFWES